jgi:phenylacetate-coenzyme A ligase PaaK-like adenylate-forming protein
MTPSPAKFIESNEPLALSPYVLNASEKESWLLKQLMQLTRYHHEHCAAYARMLDVISPHWASTTAISDLPFLPVRLFKEMELISIERDEVFKTMTSSGTTGQQVSRIHLDKATAALQTKVLAKLMTDLLGKNRLPMLIVDSPSVLRDRQAFSARGAGILGFSLFGRDVTYALNDNMELDLPRVEAFLEKHRNQPVFVFGFTFMVWQHLYMPLKAMNRTLQLEQGILLHGGGWKKLLDQAVDNPAFKAALEKHTGLSQVVNYYGMVEQTGSIYIECSAGHLHVPVYSDILIRDPLDFSVLPFGQPGLIETLSLLPGSYPGHALLTEDVGTLLGQDDCACGRLGKYFSVHGRIPRAEVRGCSDTYTAHA